MDGVVDSNIIFSAIISGNEKYIDIFHYNDLYMPDIVLKELEKYEERIIKKTKLDEFYFRSFVKNLFEEITVIPNVAISKDNFNKASELCKDIDEKDTAFVALSLELNYPLWTNDKELINGLKNKGFNNFIFFENLLEYLS